MNINSDRILQKLYAVRAVVQLVWAAAVILLASRFPAVVAALLVVYPLWDVAATLYDLNRNREASLGARQVQYANVVLGVATAVALVVFNLNHEGYAVASFGVWALSAGLLQLAVGVLRRRQTGGQWAMILSGAQSTPAGVAFTLGGLTGKLHGKDLGGYAVFGAVYFLISAALLTRRIAKEALVD